MEIERRNYSILPHINRSKLLPENDLEFVIQNKISSLENKICKCETANLKLVEIVIQLKNTLDNILSYDYQNGYSKSQNLGQLESPSSEIGKRFEIQQKSVSNNFNENGLFELSNHLISTKNEIEILRHDKNRMDGSILKLTEEIAQIKNQLLISGDMLVETTNQCNIKAKQLHEDYLNNLSSLTEKMNYSQESARQIVSCNLVLEDQKDTLNDFKNELNRIKIRLEQYNHDFSNSDTNLKIQLSQLAQKLNDEKRMRDVELRRLDFTYQETISMQNSTRVIMENHFNGLLSESESKQMDRESDVRLTLTEKIWQFEKLLLNEKEARISREREIYDRINKVMEQITEHQYEFHNEIKQHIQENQNKMKHVLYEVDTGMRLLEKISEEKFRNIYQVIFSEIATREKLQEAMKSNTILLREEIGTGISKVELSLSGLANKIYDRSEIDELKHLMERRMGDVQLNMTRNLVDFDAQLSALCNQMSSITLRVDARIVERSNDLSNEIREILAPVITCQAKNTIQLKDMQDVRATIMEELAKMQLSLNQIESHIPTQITMETDERVQQIGEIRHQIESLKIAMYTKPEIRELDIDKIQESIRKLAETLQLITSTMGMKIQSEQELRLTQIKDLQTEIRLLEEHFIKYSDYPGNTEKTRKYFIKPSENSVEDWHNTPISFIQLNHWSIYSLWKWIKYKEKLILWKTRAIKNKGNKKTKKSKGFWKNSKK